MYNYDNIIARLRAGEDAEVIANEMVGILNKASRDYTSEMEAQKAAQKAQEEKKVQVVSQLVDGLTQYVREFHPTSPLIQVFDEVGQDLDIKDLVAQIDKAIEEVEAAMQITSQVEKEMEKIFGGNPNTGFIPRRTQQPVKGQDAIAAFLKANGL